MEKGALVVVSGFSGAGKGTLMKRLLELHDHYALSVSMTTRGMRPGEENGKSYFFVSKEEFEKTIAENGLIEYASYCDNYYGTPKAYVEKCLAEGKDVILEIEVQGAKQVKKQFPEAILMFVATKSAVVLKERLTGRGTETEEVINKRLTRAIDEAKEMDAYDYVVINDDLDECAETINDIVSASKNEVDKRRGLVEQISKDLKDMLG